jgi:hypothetical protein
LSTVEKIVDAEITDENLPAIIEPKKKRGSLSIRYRRIAEMAARGWSPEEIAKEVKLRQDTVYEILKTDEVWEYVKEVIKDIFSEGDRILAFLYKKSLKGLDDDLLSDNADVRKSAREQVLKFLVRDGGEKSHISFIQQVYNTKGGESSVIESIDDLILQKRKERGLPTENGTDEIEMEEEQ